MHEADLKAVSGQCLCGAITYTAKSDGNAGVCHCKMCRRWSGGTVFGLEVSDLQITGTDTLSVYHSSDWGERGFCKTCGSNLFWRMQDGSHVAIMAGSLNEENELALGSEIFIDHKPAYYDFANDTQKMTEAEVIAMFSGDAGGNT